MLYENRIQGTQKEKKEKCRNKK